MNPNDLGLLFCVRLWQVVMKQMFRVCKADRGVNSIHASTCQTIIKKLQRRHIDIGRNNWSAHPLDPRQTNFPAHSKLRSCRHSQKKISVCLKLVPVDCRHHTFSSDPLVSSPNLAPPRRIMLIFHSLKCDFYGLIGCSPCCCCCNIITAFSYEPPVKVILLNSL